ncbi:MAG: type II secretion system F family protein [archaeon]
MIPQYVALSRRIFGKTAKRHATQYANLKRDIRQANIQMLLEIYLSLALLTSFLIGMVSLILSFPLLYATVGFFAVLFSAICGVFIGVLSYLVFLIYPYSRAKRRANDIDRNLPFAMMHAATIASSGVAPASIFRLLAKTDYGELTVESRKVQHYIDSFGVDLTTAMKRVARSTPSKRFAELLLSLNAVIRSGGNLKAFFYESSESAVTDFKIEQRVISDKLNIIAETYSVVLIGGPLLVFVGLSTMSMVWSQLAGMQIDMVMKFLVYFVLPVLNLIFLIILQEIK